jgi:hypothetical protein
LAEKRGSAEVSAAKKLFEWASGRSLSMRWGTGMENGSFSAVFGDIGGPAIVRVWTSGSVTIPFGALSQLPPYDDEDKRLRLIARLNAVRGVSIPSSKVLHENSFRLSTLVHEANLRQFIETLDLIVDEIEEMLAGGPTEPTQEDYLRVLTHIPVPAGQQQLYRALYAAGDRGLTHEELVEAMGRRDLQDLSGVLGALGHRISGVPGYGEARRPGVEMVISYEQLADGQQRLRLEPEMCQALEKLNPGWLHDATPGSSEESD